MGFTLTGTPKARGFQLGWVGLCRLRLGVIIFSSVRFLSKKITKSKKIILKKTETRSNRPVSIRFSFLGRKPVQTGLARFSGFGSVFSGFGSGFFGLARFFRFGSVFPVWLGFFPVFCRFRFGSVFSVFCL